MNNIGPFFNPFMEYEKLINKIDRLEKDIRILENRLNNLERLDKKEELDDEPTDKYMI